MIGVRVMFDSRYWNKAFAFYNQCLELPYLRVEAVRILPEIAGGHTIGADYTAEQLNWLALASRRQVDSQRHFDIKKNKTNYFLSSIFLEAQHPFFSDDEHDFSVLALAAFLSFLS